MATTTTATAIQPPIGTPPPPLTISAAAAEPFFDPRNQTFFIAGRNGNVSIPIMMSTIEAQRVRLANLAINYGCQLGLTLMSVVVVLLLLPPSRMRRPLHVAQLSALVVAAARLSLLVVYFPGPLAGYYVAWTRDGGAGLLGPSDYAASTAASALGVAQFALVEAALVMQGWVLIRTWPRAWQLPLLALSGLLAAATVAVKGVWAAQHAQLLLRGRTLPVPLTRVGEADVALGAVSVFWFCGIFFAHLALHLICTRGLIAGPRPPRSLRSPGGRRGRRCICAGFALSSLEILAIGNGILMLVPSLFAGLDIAAGIGDTRVLPFDAGSWVQTLTAAGLPLIGLVAHHRGSNSRNSSRAVSLFFAKQEGAQAPATTTQTDEAALTSFRRRSSGSSATAAAVGEGGSIGISVGGSGGSRRYGIGHNNSNNSNIGRAIMMKRISRIEGAETGEGERRVDGRISGGSSNENNTNNNNIQQQQQRNTTPTPGVMRRVEEKKNGDVDADGSARLNPRRDRRRTSSGIYVRTDYSVTVEEGRGNSSTNEKNSERVWHAP